jgi:pre-mRNA-splicing factor ATP-dependent RNA helicase DHX15/PRP43
MYYDIPNFPKGEIKTALMRVEEKLRRKKAMKGGR